MSNPALQGQGRCFDPVAQRDAAMALANQIRSAMKNIKGEIKPLSHRDGCARVAEFLIDPEEPAAAIRVRALLRAIRLMGNTKADNLLWQAGIANGDKRVRELTDRQRVALADHLRVRAGR